MDNCTQTTVCRMTLFCPQLKNEKKIIPEAYNNIYKGFPWENCEEMTRKKSDSDIPKFEKVIGNNNKAEAKIAGITPAVFIFNGKWDDSPPYIFVPICLLG